MSFKVEVTGVPRGNWAANALRFRTQKEARMYALDLAMRWFGMGDSRIRRSKDPVNYVWDFTNSKLTPLPQPDTKDA